MSREMVRLAKREAVRRVKAHTSPEWFETARLVVAHLARQRSTFTTDDVWVMLHERAPHLPMPHENRAMGAVMLDLARHGMIKATDQYINSDRAVCHGRPVRVWRSCTNLKEAAPCPLPPLPSPSVPSSSRSLACRSSLVAIGRASSETTMTKSSAPGLPFDAGAPHVAE